MPSSNYSNSVREFARIFGHPLDQDVLPFDLDKMKIELIEEEFNEVKDAWREYRWALSMKAENRATDDQVKTAKANLLKELQDLKYVTFGYEEAHGMSGDEAFNRVHASNMSKLDADGKPIYREDGKVLKGPNYKKPNLIGLL